jgi:hypothetical protein
MSNSNYKESIIAISLLEDEQKLLLIGEEYQYQIQIDSTFNEILKIIVKPSLEVIMLKNYIQVKKDNSIKMNFLLVYPKEILSKSEIEYLYNSNFLVNNQDTKYKNKVIVEFERVAKRDQVNSKIKVQDIQKSLNFTVEEELTKSKSILATLIKPITILIDTFIFIFALIAYSFQV